MTISKSNYLILKLAALQVGNNKQVLQAIEQTEKAEKERSLKTSQYILERRKKDKNYCR